MKRKKGLSNCITLPGLILKMKAEVAAAASVPLSVICMFVFEKISFHDSIKIMSYTLRTALCCSVSSLNSFQELVIGEKSLEGVPENSLFIPVKEEILDLFSILIFWEMGENFM